MKRCNCSVPSQLRKDYHILFIRKTRYLFRKRGLFHEKKYVFCFASFFFCLYAWSYLCIQPQMRQTPPTIVFRFLHLILTAALLKNLSEHSI